MFVDVPLAPTAKIPRELLTSLGALMPVGLPIEMFQLMRITGQSRCFL